MSTVQSLFKVSYGNKLDMNKMARASKESGVAFVARKGGLGGHAGVSGFVEPIAGVEPYPAGLLTVALGGSRLLSTYVQQRPFYTAQNVAVLEPRDSNMPTLHRLFYAMCIRHNAFRYTAFGREANRTLGSISIPSIVPDWVDTTPLPTFDGMAQSELELIPLDDPLQWTLFPLGSLFEIAKGRRVTKADRLPGRTPFIGASEKNNGITDSCDLEPMFAAHCLTVPYNGNSVGVAFYQNRPFVASDDVQVLVPRDGDAVSHWALLFVAAVIRHERSRYTYGYKWNMARMRKTSIRLPSTGSGEPDWQYMERFMMGLPFSSAVVGYGTGLQPAA